MEQVGLKGKNWSYSSAVPPTHHPRAELKSGCSYMAGGVRALTLPGMSFPTNYFDMQKSHFFDHAFQGLPLSAVIRFFIRENHFLMDPSQVSMCVGGKENQLLSGKDQ